MRKRSPWVTTSANREAYGLTARPAHVTKAHAARELGITRGRVAQLIAARELLTICLAGHEYVLATSLDKLLIERRII